MASKAQQTVQDLANKAGKPSEEQSDVEAQLSNITTLIAKSEERQKNRIDQLQSSVQTVRTEFGHLKESYTDLLNRCNALGVAREEEMTAIGTFRREQADSSLKMGAEVRKMSTRVQNLETLRATQADPEVKLRPVRAQLGEAIDKLNRLEGQVNRFGAELKKFFAATEEDDTPPEDDGDGS